VTIKNLKKLLKAKMAEKESLELCVDVKPIEKS
jgi:hypothetical protein